MNIDLTHPEILTIEQLQKYLIKVNKMPMLFPENKTNLVYFFFRIYISLLNLISQMINMN